MFLSFSLQISPVNLDVTPNKTVQCLISHKIFAYEILSTKGAELIFVLQTMKCCDMHFTFKGFYKKTEQNIDSICMLWTEIWREAKNFKIVATKAIPTTHHRVSDSNSCS